MDKNIFDITPQPDPRPGGNCYCGDAYKPLMNRLFDMHLDSDCDCADNLTSSWIQIRKIIDESMEKRDRSVSIYINPENGISVNVNPWPDYEDLYEMYKDGWM